MTKKIYIVDDDADIVETMKITLEKKGYKVAFQHDDKDLAENIRSFNPDLVILDVMFPGDDGAGFKIARTIRHHDHIKDLPILMLSGVNKEGSFQGKFSNKDIDELYMPITEFVDKPVKPDILLKKVEALTTKKK